MKECEETGWRVDKSALCNRYNLSGNLKSPPVYFKSSKCHAHVHSLLENSPEVEATHVSTDGWMDKQNEVCTCSRVFSLIKKQNSDQCYNMDEPWKYYAKWKSQIQKDRYYMVPFIWEKYRDIDSMESWSESCHVNLCVSTSWFYSLYGEAKDFNSQHNIVGKKQIWKADVTQLQELLTARVIKTMWYQYK